MFKCNESLTIECTGRHPATVFRAVLATLMALACHADAAEAFRAPRTSWGDPVIQGVYTNNTNVPFERPVELRDRDFYTEQEFQQRRNQPVKVETTTVINDAHYETADYGLDPLQSAMVRNLRTSILTQPADGRMPMLTDDARRRSEAARTAQQERAFNSAQDRPLQERCLLWAHEGPPLRPVGYNTLVRIVQARGYVVVMTEMLHDARVIPVVSARPDFQGLTRWQGNSWARWEGETLVIETTGVSDKVWPRGAAVPMSPAGRIIEKITRTGLNAIRYEFLVSDPALWVSSWGGEFPMEISAEPMLEYACHEGNYGLPNTLRGIREEERAGIR